MKTIILYFIIALLLFFTTAHAETECHRYTKDTPISEIDQGFGVPWNVLSNEKELLIKTICNQSTIDVEVGNGNELQYIWSEGWLSRGGLPWEKVTYSGTNTVQGWIVGHSSTTIPMSIQEQYNTNWLIVYICMWTGTEWKCGCRDASCIPGSTGGMWQLQKVKSVEEGNAGTVLNGVIIESETLFTKPPETQFHNSSCVLRVQLRNTTSQLKNVYLVYNGFNDAGEGFAIAMLAVGSSFVSPNSVAIQELYWVTTDGSGALTSCSRIARFELDPSSGAFP